MQTHVRSPLWRRRAARPGAGRLVRVARRRSLGVDCWRRRNLPIGQTQVAAERIVAEDDVAALFGLELEPAPGSKDANTGLKSGISGRTKLATPFNRPPAKEPIPLNSNSMRTKPTPTRSKDAKTFQVSSGARPQTTDANANLGEARIARGKTKSATPPIRLPRKAPKQDVAAKRG